MDEVLKKFHDACAANSWKQTPQRWGVFRAVYGNPNHPTVDEVHRRVSAELPGISLDTVYRILRAFACAGIVHRFEHCAVIRCDCNTQEHSHFICRRCGKIIDFTTDHTLPEAAGARFGRCESSRWHISGVCHDCLKKEPSS